MDPNISLETYLSILKQLQYQNNPKTIIATYLKLSQFLSGISFTNKQILKVLLNLDLNTS